MPDNHHVPPPGPELFLGGVCIGASSCCVLGFLYAGFVVLASMDDDKYLRGALGVILCLVLCGALAMRRAMRRPVEEQATDLDAEQPQEEKEEEEAGDHSLRTVIGSQQEEGAAAEEHASPTFSR